jgi:hypothetical protein
VPSRDYRLELTEMIDRLLAGTWTVEEFERAYYTFFLDEVPSEALSEDERDFFAEIQEMLEWTGPSLTSEEKQYGWMTYEEYVDWVRLHRIRFLS